MKLLGAGKRAELSFAFIMGIVGAAISIGRLLWANSEALTQILWAEDGLFTLCAQKVGALDCALDPYAGYSTFLPRVFAGITALFPPSAWALIANLLAASLIGFAVGFIVWWLRRYGISTFTSTAVSLLLVLAPIIGFEVINVFACAYVPLLFMGTIVIAFPIRPYPVKTAAIVLLLASLTIPTAALLLLFVGFQIVVRSLAKKSGIVLLGALALGLIVQLVFIVTTSTPRTTTLGLEAFSDWVKSMPIALLTYIPGIQLGNSSIFTNYSSTASDLLPWLIVIALTVWAVWLLILKDERLRAAGLMVSSALILGAAPTVFLAANVRYFVVPCLLIAGALLIALDAKLRSTSPVVLSISVVVVTLVWWPALPASAWRSTPAPAWQPEVARVAAHCMTDQLLVERPVFTPFFPPNWGDGMAEPTHPNLPCSTGWTWK